MRLVSPKSTFIPAGLLYEAIVDSSDDATRRRRAEFGRASGQIEPECDPSRSGRPSSHRSDVREGIDQPRNCDRAVGDSFNTSGALSRYRVNAVETSLRHRSDRERAAT